MRYSTSFSSPRPVTNAGEWVAQQTQQKRMFVLGVRIIFHSVYTHLYNIHFMSIIVC